LHYNSRVGWLVQLGAAAYDNPGHLTLGKDFNIAGNVATRRRPRIHPCRCRRL
jgi:hypothetical protein